MTLDEFLIRYALCGCVVAFCLSGIYLLGNGGNFPRPEKDWQNVFAIFLLWPLALVVMIVFIIKRMRGEL